MQPESGVPRMGSVGAPPPEDPSACQARDPAVEGLRVYISRVHPPAPRPKATYAQMAGAALAALGERDGSTRQQIRAWVSQEYGLPGLLVSQSREWKLLNSALKKEALFLQGRGGRWGKVASGKFKLRNAAGSAPALVSSGRASKRQRTDGDPPAAVPGAPPFWAHPHSQPPAAIVFSSGARTVHPGPWFSSREAGQAAVSRLPSADLGLLGGTAELQFELGADETCSHLCPAVRVRPRSVPASGGVEHWAKSGEFSGELPCEAGHLVVLSRLIGAVQDGALLPAQSWAEDWLHAVHSLVMLRDSPWKAPLVRVICPAPLGLSAPSHSPG